MTWSEVFSILWKWNLGVVLVVIVLTVLDREKEVFRLVTRFWYGLLAALLPTVLLLIANGISQTFDLTIQQGFVMALGIVFAWHCLKILILSPPVMASICRRRSPGYREFVSKPWNRSEREAVVYSLDEQLEWLRMFLGSTYILMMTPLKALYIKAILDKNSELLTDVIGCDLRNEEIFLSRYALKYKDGEEICMSAHWKPLLICLFLWVLLHDWHA